MPSDATPPKKSGQPTKFTQAIADEICSRMADGETLTNIMKDQHMPSSFSVVWGWRQQQPEFSKAYARAREDQMHAWADQIVTEAQDGTGDYVVDEKTGKRVWQRHNIDRTRLIIDTKKWLMARLNAADFGDKSTVDVNHGLQTKDDAELLSELQQLSERLGLSLPDHLTRLHNAKTIN
jgi:hypothetical protein